MFFKFIFFVLKCPDLPFTVDFAALKSQMAGKQIKFFQIENVIYNFKVQTDLSLLLPLIFILFMKYFHANNNRWKSQRYL